MSTFPTAEDIKQFIERASSGRFTAQDLDAFYQKPQSWRFTSTLPTYGDAQTFWQMVWDELALEIGGRIIVPPVPQLTDRQRKSVMNYRMLFVYIPALSEDRYPACFVKTNWNRILENGDVERRPLQGQWIAIETIGKPDHNDPKGYPDDRLMAAVKRDSRFNVSWDDLHEYRYHSEKDCCEDSLLTVIAESTGMPKKGTRLPTVEEWNLIANLFNWLRDHRAMDLPDLGSTRSREWCENCLRGPYESRYEDNRLTVGDSGYGGIADIASFWRGDCSCGFGFRVLFEL